MTTLRPNHLDDLRRSGLRDETIKALAGAAAAIGKTSFRRG